MNTNQKQPAWTEIDDTTLKHIKCCAMKEIVYIFEVQYDYLPELCTSGWESLHFVSP